MVNQQLSRGLHKDGKTIRKVNYTLVLCFMVHRPSPRKRACPQQHLGSSWCLGSAEGLRVVAPQWELLRERSRSVVFSGHTQSQIVTFVILFLVYSGFFLFSFLCFPFTFLFFCVLFWGFLGFFLLGFFAWKKKTLKCYWGDQSYEWWHLEGFTFCVGLLIWWCICSCVDFSRGKN